MNDGRSFSKVKLNKKTFIQSKLCFPEITQSTTNKEKGKYVSCSVVSEKKKFKLRYYSQNSRCLKAKKAKIE